MGQTESSNLDEVLAQNFTLFADKLYDRVKDKCTISRVPVTSRYYDQLMATMKNHDMKSCSSSSSSVRILTQYLTMLRNDGDDCLLPSDPNAEYWKSLPVANYGAPSNKNIALFGPILNKILPYLSGDRVLQHMPFVCVNWFLQFYTSMLCMRFFSVICDFLRTYEKHLRLYDVLLTPQRVMNSRDGCRLDLVFYAEVLSSCEGKLIELSHTYRYDRTLVTSHQNMVVPKNSSFSTDQNYLASYKVYTYGKNKPRSVWLISDMQRKNRNDIRLSQTPPIGLACVGDVVEIPINVMSDFGSIDPISLVFKPPKVESSSPPPQPEFAETCHDVWVTYETFKRLNHRIPNLAADIPPHLITKRADGIGSALPTIRQIINVKEPGDLKIALADYGQLFMIQEKGKPICVTLGRLGLQHDRLQLFWLRQGDLLYMYRVTGGPLEPSVRQGRPTEH